MYEQTKIQEIKCRIQHCQNSRLYTSAAIIVLLLLVMTGHPYTIINILAIISFSIVNYCDKLEIKFLQHQTDLIVFYNNPLSSEHFSQN